MYMIYVDANDKDIMRNGMAPEEFWGLIKVNLEDNGFMQLEGTHKYYAEWKEEATLGHVWALQAAFVNDLPECVRSMTDYTVYEVGRTMKDPVRPVDAERFGILKTYDGFADVDNIEFMRNANYLDNMLHEIDLTHIHGKRKKKPIDFHRIEG